MVLQVIMVADLKSIGTCHYTATEETFWGTHVYSALRKNSPYTKSISIGYTHLKFWLQNPVFLCHISCSDFWSSLDLFGFNDFFCVMSFRNRILRLKEVGLLGGEWEKWHVSSSSNKCMKVNVPCSTKYLDCHSKAWAVSSSSWSPVTFSRWLYLLPRNSFLFIEQWNIACRGCLTY